MAGPVPEPGPPPAATGRQLESLPAGATAAIPGLATLLDQFAPLTEVPLCPGLRAFTARSLVEIWDAAEARAGGTLAAPFWAFPWPAGVALARAVLDRPGRVRGKRVLDVGCGGGVASIACAMAGARVLANDTDPIALAVVRLAAERQGVALETLCADVTREPERTLGFDVILCGDLGYDRGAAARERAVLTRAARNGATVLLADAERAFFDATGLELLAEHLLPVVRDLEGVDVRRARVYRLPAQ